MILKMENKPFDKIKSDDMKLEEAKKLQICLNQI